MEHSYVKDKQIGEGTYGQVSKVQPRQPSSAPLLPFLCTYSCTSASAGFKVGNLD